MGAWGHQGFQNDDALDWVSNELEPAFDMSPVVFALGSICDADEDAYLELPECGAAVAAAEVLAAARGRSAPNLPDSVSEWISARAEAPDAALLASATQALDRILAGSEMQSVWDESESGPAWRKAIADLKQRLGQ